MKLLMLTTVGITLKAFLLSYADYFRAQGWHVDAAASDVADYPELREHFDHLHSVSFSRSPVRLVQLARAAGELRSLVRHQGYDLVHVHTPVAAFVTRWALRDVPGVRMVYTAHGFHFYQGGPPAQNTLYRLAETLAGPWTDELVVINREDEAAASRLGLVSPERLHFSHGIGVDLDRYGQAATDPAALRAELGLGPETRALLMVAEMIPRKRHTDALDALELLAHKDVVLLLAGDGPLRPALEAEVRRRKLPVRFLGWRSDVSALLSLADALLLPSLQEGLPRSVLEAMVSGTPVVASGIRGIQDLLQGEAGWLVPPRHPAALSIALAELLRSPQEARRRAALARQRVLDYATGPLLEQQEQWYEAALSRPRAWPGRRLDLQQRTLDLGVTLPALALLALPMLLTALVVRLQLGSPVLFTQQRPGRDGRPFKLMKFRSMTDARDAQGQLLPDAQRLPAFGRFLRSSSLDELPELFNVLRGEMSLVGPRPLLMQYLPLYSPEQRRRHEVRPGLTGLAQVSGRNALSWEQKFALDLQYIRHRSVWLDLSILWRTVIQVLRRDGIEFAQGGTEHLFTGTPLSNATSSSIHAGAQETV